jgi:hypothetical protein
MAVKIVTSWTTLFRLAHAYGQARLKYNASPSESNSEALAKAKEAHDAYRDLCLQSDDMIGLPDVSMSA